jgi:NAD(P)-dependent dehydrogenase (short-subunit alcohol dehydrogenase family)
MNPDLAGKAVIVTGGTRGIGATVARRYLEAGAYVLVCGRTAPDRPPTSGERSAEFVQADVRQPDQAAGVVDTAVDRFGRIDILVNNAGGSPMADAATVSPRFISSIVSLNLLAPFFLAQRANAVMQEQADGGLILNIGSVAGYDPAPGTAAYSAAKAGLTILTRALALEFGPRVRVNQVTVGLVQTELSHLYYGDQLGLAAVAATIPLRRMAVPDDVAAACLLLSSPLANYVNGTDLLVDGGGEIPARFLAARPATG